MDVRLLLGVVEESYHLARRFHGARRQRNPHPLAAAGGVDEAQLVVISFLALSSKRDDYLVTIMVTIDW